MLPKLVLKPDNSQVCRPPNCPILCSWLLQFRVAKGEEYTHTSMGKPLGSFNIPISEKKTLIKILNNELFVKKKFAHITEKPQQHTSIKIDLDFKYDLSVTTRQYTIDQIRSLVELYNQAIVYYTHVESGQLHSFIFERRAPYKSTKQKCTKDGVHIIYPYITCDTNIQHLIRKWVLLHCQPILSQLNCSNAPDDIIDKAIISKNNWLMYGCSKPNIPPYYLTHIYDPDLTDIPFADAYTNEELIALLSIRDHDESQSVALKVEHDYLLKKKDKDPPPPVISQKPKITLKSKKTNCHLFKGKCSIIGQTH